MTGKLEKKKDIREHKERKCDDCGREFGTDTHYSIQILKYEYKPWYMDMTVLGETRLCEDCYKKMCEEQKKQEERDEAAKELVDAVCTVCQIPKDMLGYEEDKNA